MRVLELACVKEGSADGALHADTVSHTLLQIPHDGQLPPQRRLLGHVH